MHLCLVRIYHRAQVVQTSCNDTFINALSTVGKFLSALGNLEIKEASLDKQERDAFSASVVHTSPRLVLTSSLIASSIHRSFPSPEHMDLSHSMRACPIPCSLYGCRFIFLPSLCDVVSQRVIWVRRSEKSLNGE